MKYFLLILILFNFFCPVLADDAVYLDLNAEEIPQYETYTPKIENAKNNSNDDFSEEKQMIMHPFEYLREESKDLYSSKTISNKKEKKAGKAKFGAKCDTTLAPDSVLQKRTLYSNYELTPKMSVGADYQTNSIGGIDVQKQGTFGVGPEYQFNEKIKLKNKYSKNLGNSSNKSEISVEYKPFQDEMMNFNAGASQTQQDSGPGSSQVNFGANFKF